MKRSEFCMARVDTVLFARLINVRLPLTRVHTPLRVSIRDRLWVSGVIAVGAAYVMDGVIVEMRQSKLPRRRLKRSELVASIVPDSGYRFLADRSDIFWHLHRTCGSGIDREVPIWLQLGIVDQTRPPADIAAEEVAYTLTNAPLRLRGRNIEAR